MSLHAVEEMEDEGFTVLDIEHAMLTGKIVLRQKGSRDWRMEISGEGLDAFRKRDYRCGEVEPY